VIASSFQPHTTTPRVYTTGQRMDWDEPRKKQRGVPLRSNSHQTIEGLSEARLLPIHRLFPEQLNVCVCVWAETWGAQRESRLKSGERGKARRGLYIDVHVSQAGAHPELRRQLAVDMVVMDAPVARRPGSVEEGRFFELDSNALRTYRREPVE